jgi:aryl-alcohol dehydrogenase-like predicted oxidoreductase
VEKRRIGSLEVSVVGLGCNNFGWRIDAAGTALVVDAAFDAGINFFDTADIYGAGQSEQFLGAALGGRRNSIVLATKFGMKSGELMPGGAKPAYVTHALDESLRRLGTDYIDLYQLHQPDPSTPIADTLGALEDAVRAGKVREIGCSNFTAEMIGAAPRFKSVQNHYSLLHREPETNGVLEACVRGGVGFIPYFPLANGLLSGKYRKGAPLPEGSRGLDGFGPKVFTEENLAKVESLAAYAASQGHTLLELAMSWLASRPAVVSVIAGAKTPEQVHANAGSAGWGLSEGDVREIEKRVS